MAQQDNYVQQLYELLLSHFDLSELRTLCFFLGIEYDDLLDEGRSAKARELLLLLARKDRLVDFLKLVREERPSVQWPDVPPDFQPFAPNEQTKVTGPAGATFHIGQIQAASVNVGGVQNIGHLDVDIGSITADSPLLANIPPELASLINNLKQKLTQASVPLSSDIQKISKRLEVLTKELAQATVDKEMALIFARSLEQSIESVADTLPQLPAIARKITAMLTA